MISSLITINPKVCNGKPVIRGTRIPVSVILDNLAVGSSFQEIRRKYPELNDEQIQAAIQFSSHLIDHLQEEPLNA